MERIMPDRGGYTQKELLSLLRVKPHVLRYWEQTLPLIRSRRDDAGRRVWTAGQVRMLMRIRHLVVDRGVGVGAAGDALLREAEGTPAAMKAGLERVRNALVVLLIKVQSRDAGTYERGPAREEDRSYPGDAVPIRSLFEDGLPDRWEPRRAPPPLRITRDASRDALDVFASSGGITRSIPLIYSHLFVDRPAEIVAPMMARLVDYRYRGETGIDIDATPLVVAAPQGRENAYRNAFPGNTLILSVSPVENSGHEYSAPTLGVLTAIASSRLLDQYMQRWEREALYLWAADNPQSPAVDVLQEEAFRSQVGIALGLHRSRSGYRLSEAVGIHVPTWRPMFKETVRCGHWLPAAGGRDGFVFPGFAVWLQDLTRMHPHGVLLRDARRPIAWRDADWPDQLRLAWPEVSFSV